MAETIIWIHCPICGGKTRVSIREDTVLKNFPMYCHKCKQVSVIDAEKLKVNLSQARK